ncbi:hypothetical protein [Pseudopedobacter beijingensis]|uniref:tRNA (Guanine-N1)-methyltransferase n=1 Tax=Pseudopedobacter beijingensis TaxID=1207056 RepID=A0ABW4IFY6_9SPHI
MRTFKHLLMSILFLYLSVVAKGQEITNNNINNQFKQVFEQSNDYQNYKVIKKSSFNSLWKNSLDTLNIKDHKIASELKTINQKNTDIQKLKQELERKNTELIHAKQSVDEIYFLGFIGMNKSLYNIICFSIIAILLIICIIIYIWNKHSKTTAKEKSFLYDEICKEYKTFKTRSHENEKKLARELQDERNKLAEHNIR